MADHLSGAEISLRGLVKRYGPVQAVDRLDIDISPGEFLSLLGSSGSGKTTTLMMIAGFEMPDDGSILVDGVDIVGLPANKRNMGMVFQSYALFPHMSVFDNVAYSLQMRHVGRSEIRHRVGDILDLVRLPIGTYGDRRPAQLSGGQQQRVALARAIVFEPRVLLMDEPLGALDKKLRTEMQVEIKQLQVRLGLTVVYVTHDQEEALTMSDRIALLRDGRIEQIGDPEALYERPDTAYAASFLGESNFIEVVPSTVGQGAWELVNGKTVPMLRGSLAADGPGLLAIRPERICLQVDHGLGFLDGTVSAATYVGDHRRFEIKTDAGPVIARLPARGVLAGLAVGTAVSVHWEPDSPVRLPARQATGPASA